MNISTYWEETIFEPKEENPMIGWRGASRYYSETFREAIPYWNAKRSKWYGINSDLKILP